MRNAIISDVSRVFAAFPKCPMHVLTSVALLICTLIIRMVNLSNPPTLMVDEVYYAPAAKSLLEMNGDPNYVHPPLGKALIALGIVVFGYNSLGWRIAGAVAGSILIPVTYLFGRRVFSDPVAVLASALLIIDPLTHVMSRVAMLDVFLALFVAVAFLAVCYGRPYLSGIALGLASGVKLVGAFAVVGVSAYLICIRASGKLSGLLLVTLLTFMVSLLPVAVSLDSSPFINSFWFSVSWHLTLDSPHSYASPPAGWLVNIAPFPIYSASGLNITANANPFIYPLALPAAALLGYSALKRRDCQPSTLLILWFASVYGLFFALPRKTQFIFYLLPAVPAILLLASFGIVRVFTYLSE
ncbi:phospholipid carrier-dependent glycosyltransferase [Candidatus Bathyarchaeota archaeon]|nr:phospholipid carrier-dependent glycosyltransferase [Candidatus Bathyarchaeota archaeon]